MSFTHVEDDLKVPMPPGAEIETYVVYVGFDPLGARPRPAAKQPPQKKR